MTRGVYGLIVIAVACVHREPAQPQPAQPAKRRLAVLLAESDAFPRAAAAVSRSLAAAHVAGVDDTQVSKVSLEVAQLSIECVDSTALCYQAVGKQLSANKLLFAQLAPGATKKALKVTVTLFDVDASAPARTAEKVFASEADATAGADNLVAEATRP